MIELSYNFGGGFDVEGKQWEFEVDNRMQMEFYMFNENVDYKTAFDLDEQDLEEYCLAHEEELKEYFEDEAYDEYEYWK